MHKFLRNIIILISSFLIMIIVNETSKMFLNKHNKSVVYDVNSLYSTEKNKESCTWACYFNTTYCKKHHVKYMRPYFKYIDGFYFGQIKFLHLFGNYTVANIVFLVILWPGLMFFLLIKVIDQHKKIKQLKRN